MTTYRMTIRNAPPGILMTRSGLTVFKTEYQDQDSSGTYRPICYVVISGERYHGDGYDVDCIEVTQDAIDAVTPCGFLCPTCKGARFTHAMPDGTRGVCFDQPGCTMDRQPCLGVRA